MKNSYRDVFDKLEWNVAEYESIIEIQKYSPVGEDFLVSVSKDNLVNDLIEYYMSFDSEVHAYDIYSAGRNGLKGVPNLHVLLKDADEIDDMLETLIIELSKAELIMEG